MLSTRDTEGRLLIKLDSGSTASGEWNTTGANVLNFGNEMTIADNAADAFHISDAGGIEYIRLVTTNAQPVVRFNDGGVDVDVQIEAVGFPYTLFTQGSTGFVSVGRNAPIGHLDVYDDIIDTTASYYGIYNHHVKTLGATDYLDVLRGIHNYIEFDQIGGEIGYLHGIYNSTILTSGSVGDGGTRDMVGIYNYLWMEDATCTVTEDVEGVYTYIDLNGGIVGADILGHHIYMDLRAGMTSIAGDVYGIKLYLDADTDPTGTVYSVYWEEGTNVDYGIYQSGTALNFWGGSHQVMDDTWVGIGAAAGRLTFDSTPAPDQVKIEAADLNFTTVNHGIIHVDGIAAGEILLADGTRYVPSGWFLVGTAGQTYTFPAVGGTIPTGTGVNTQVAYWTGVNTIAGDAGMTYNAGTDSLTAGDYFTTDGGTFGIIGNELLTVNAAGTFVFSGIAGITVEDADWIGNSAATARQGFDSSGATDYVYVLGANLGVGTVTPDGIVHAVHADYLSTALFERNGRTTDDLWAAARLLATKTANMGDGFGVGLNFLIQDDAGVMNDVGMLGIVRDGADDSGAMVVQVKLAGVAHERARILSTGGFGIGTQSPIGPFHVSTLSNLASGGSVKFTNTDYDPTTNTGSGLKIYMGAAAGDTYIRMQAVDQGDSGYADLILNPYGGNLGLGTAVLGANADRVFGIYNGVVPTTSPANMIQIFSVDSSDATATLGLRTEQAVEAGAPTPSHKLKVLVNGTEYWLSLDAV